MSLSTECAAAFLFLRYPSHSLLLGRMLRVTERKSLALDYQDTYTDSRINLKLHLNLPLG